MYADKIEFLDTKGNGQGNGSAVGRGIGQQGDAADPALITDEDIRSKAPLFGFVSINPA